MKIHLYGNILNNSYNLTMFLRAKGFDAEMFLDDTSGSGQDYPWWEDKDLNPKNLPKWIHYYRVKPNFLFPQSALKEMISDFSKCDVALVCGMGPVIAYRAGVPYFFWSYGSDLTLTNLKENLSYALKQIRQLKIPRGSKNVIFNGWFQKKAIQNADRIGIAMSYQINNYIKPLFVENKVEKVRLAWDIEKYKVPIDTLIYQNFQQYEIVYFMIARHSWKSVWGDLKGNDKFIIAFSKFVKEKIPNVKLIMIEKGPDLQDSKNLVKELGIENYVEWIKEMNKDGIRAYNSLPNVVVVDQFWHDEWIKRFPLNADKPPVGFGSGSIEALSAERPLITSFFEEEFYDGNHPPVLSAFTIPQIYSRLVESYEMGPENRALLGKKGKDFVTKYHGWQNTIDIYIKVLEDIVKQYDLKSSNA